MTTTAGPPIRRPMPDRGVRRPTSGAAPPAPTLQPARARATHIRWSDLAATTTCCGRRAFRHQGRWQLPPGSTRKAPEAFSDQHHTFSGVDAPVGVSRPLAPLTGIVANADDVPHIATAAAAGTRRLSGTTSCMSRPTAAPPAGAGAEVRSPASRVRAMPPARGVRAGPASRRGHSRTVQGLLGPVAGVLHIRKGRPRRRIPCFPHDSATLPRTSVFSRRSPVCRADPSAHGRISTVLNAGTFPHDSADPPPAGLGRMCSASPTGPMPHIRPARHQPDTASTTPIPHSPYRAVAPIPGPAPPFLVRKAR